jgi:hypothetical protein
MTLPIPAMFGSSILDAQHHDDASSAALLNSNRWSQATLCSTLRA